MSKERRLGRGLEALLGRPMENPEFGPKLHFDEEADVVAPPGTDIPVDQIDPNPFQPRRDFDEDEIRNLAESIQTHGLLQPIVVRKNGARYQLVAGERRLRGAIKAGYATVAANVLELSDREVAEVAIVENLQRKDLNAVEKAASFQRYLQRYGSTQEELASRLQIDRSTLANLIRLLELPTQVQDALRAGLITPGHAKALLALENQELQCTFCQRIQDEQWSVRVTESMVQESITHFELSLPPSAPSDRPQTKPRTKSEHLASLEEELKRSLGTRVEIKQSGKGKGKVLIHFFSHEEFDRIKAQLTGSGHRPQSQAG